MLNATKLTNSKAGKKNYNVLDLVNSGKRWMTIDTDGNTVTDPEQLTALNAGKSVASIYDMEDGDKYIHSWAVEDASYLRLSNVSIGYSFPKRSYRNSICKVAPLLYREQPICMDTLYWGLTRKFPQMGNSLTPGVDFGAYPRNRSFCLRIEYHIVIPF